MSADTLSPQEKFARFVEEHDLTPEEFPKADKGADRYGRIFRALVWAIVLGVVDVATTLAYKAQLHSWPTWAGNPDSVDKAKKLSGNIWLMLRTGLYWADRVTHWLFLLSLVVLVFVVALYVVNVVQRQRRFERDVVSNDREARKLKKDLVRLLRINEQISALDEQERKKRESGSSSGDDDFIGQAVDRMFAKHGSNGLDPAQEAKRDCLVALRDMQVSINTRQDVAGDSILRMWRIIVNEPDSREASDQLRKFLDNGFYIAASQAATGLNKKRMSGKQGQSTVNFGEPVQSSDYTHWTLSTALPVEDKYAVTNANDTVAEDTQVSFAPAFDLSNLIDHSAEIAEKTAGAQKWAEQAVKSVDAILTTGEKQVNRKSVKVSARNALFTYSLPDSASVPNFNDLQEVFNKNFRTQSANVELIAGDVLITIPLPSKFNIPIDVGSMFRETFF